MGCTSEKLAMKDEGKRRLGGCRHEKKEKMNERSLSGDEKLLGV